MINFIMNLNGIFPISGSSITDILSIAADGIARPASCRVSNPGVTWPIDFTTSTTKKKDMEKYLVGGFNPSEKYWSIEITIPNI